LLVDGNGWTAATTRSCFFAWSFPFPFPLSWLGDGWTGAAAMGVGAAGAAATGMTADALTCTTAGAGAEEGAGTGAGAGSGATREGGAIRWITTDFGFRLAGSGAIRTANARATAAGTITGLGSVAA
jgi:hypothetical protein